ncbi:MAG: hypothetical protein ACYSWZ_18905, partial [Planctomycetota bacterium]
MKQIPRRFAILAGLILTVNIIGLIWIHNGLTRLPKATVRMTSLHLSPDKYKADRLTLLFDRDLVSKESVGGIEHAGLFTLEPDWPGNWQWSALNRLEYMLDKPLPPGRVFWTRATDEFQARTGKVIEGDNNFRFQTVSLALKRWIQPVDPEDLLRHVKFYDDKSSGELGGAICLTKKPEEKLVVRVRRPHSNKMRIALDERLTGHEAELSLGRKIARTLAIASGFSLLNTRTDTPNLDEIISVRLQFSHRLNKEQKIPKITVEPSVEKLKVLRSYRTLRVNGKFEPGKSYKIKVPG